MYLKTKPQEADGETFVRRRRISFRGEERRKIMAYSFWTLILVVLAVSCGGTPGSPSSISPQLSLTIEPTVIKAISSAPPSFVLVDDGRPWWTLSYTITAHETRGLSATIDNYDVQFNLMDGEQVFEVKPGAQGTPGITPPVTPHSSIQIPSGSPTPAYVHLPFDSSASTPSGLLTATVHYKDANLNSQSVTTTASVMPQ
jgi:hypothetical protein